MHVRLFGVAAVVALTGGPLGFAGEEHFTRPAAGPADRTLTAGIAQPAHPGLRRGLVPAAFRASQTQDPLWSAPLPVGFRPYSPLRLVPSLASVPDLVTGALLAPVWPPLALPTRFPREIGLRAWLGEGTLGSGESTSSTVGDDSADDAASDPVTELRWLMRHKKRSVLEAHRWATDSTPSDEMRHRSTLERLVPGIPGVVATLEFFSEPPLLGNSDTAAARGGGRLVSVEGQLGNGGHWIVGGLLLDGERESWRTLSEVVLEPSEGHELTLATSWRSQPLASSGGSLAGDQALEGIVLAQDRWRFAPRMTLSLGARYSYEDSLDHPHHVDPSTSLEWQVRDGTWMRAGWTSRTLLPGGPSMSLSLFEPSPAIAPSWFAGRESLGKVNRYQLGMGHVRGTTEVETRVFTSVIRDPFGHLLVSIPAPAVWSLENGPRMQVNGWSTSVSHRFGKAFRGTLAYTLGHASRQDNSGVDFGQWGLVVPEGRYHDVMLRLSASLEATDSHVQGFSRYVSSGTGSRFNFDVQFRQGVPFMTRRTGTDLKVVVAYRNLSQEPADDGSLDDVALASPRRFLGGVSVRF
jgi:hypothetical protein